MAGKYLPCKGEGCLRSTMLEPWEPHCSKCGTKNPEFLEKELAVEMGGKSLAEVQKEECASEIHARGAKEIIEDSSERGSSPVENHFCLFCGTQLIKDYKSAVPIPT